MSLLVQRGCEIKDCCHESFDSKETTGASRGQGVVECPGVDSVSVVVGVGSVASNSVCVCVCAYSIGFWIF